MNSLWEEGKDLVDLHVPMVLFTSFLSYSHSVSGPVSCWPLDCQGSAAQETVCGVRTAWGLGLFWIPRSRVRNMLPHPRAAFPQASCCGGGEHLPWKLPGSVRPGFLWSHRLAHHSKLIWVSDPGIVTFHVIQGVWLCVRLYFAVLVLAGAVFALRWGNIAVT